jgi:hypothetical protein
MKPLHTLRILGILIGTLGNGFIYALPDAGGCVKGRVTWDETKQPIITATIAFENETVAKGFFTHEKGRYYACYIPEGTYTVTVSFGAITITVPNVKVTDGDVKELNFSLPVDLPVVPISSTPIQPAIATKPDNNAEDENTLPRASPKSDYLQNDMIASTAIPLNMWSSSIARRDEGTVSWYIDGCKVTGNHNVPIRGVESVFTYSGSVPAKYGDTNGAVVAIETRSLLFE